MIERMIKTRARAREIRSREYTGKKKKIKIIPNSAARYFDPVVISVRLAGAASRKYARGRPPSDVPRARHNGRKQHGGRRPCGTAKRSREMGGGTGRARVILSRGPSASAPSPPATPPGKTGGRYDRVAVLVNIRARRDASYAIRRCVCTYTDERESKKKSEEKKTYVIKNI